ncbi:hypothetical protein [Enterovibrio sp. 27052020O]|uniref:hypothetical protein n=1 Tax=Enterovibrio sp. 27052020O TaxID=3241166 RepID=UPI00388E3832
MNAKYLKKYTNLAGSLSLAFLSASVIAGNYTPKDFPDGQLPSNDPNITFTTYDANWVSEIKLPIAPQDHALPEIWEGVCS